MQNEMGLGCFPSKPFLSPVSSLWLVEMHRMHCLIEFLLQHRDLTWALRLAQLTFRRTPPLFFKTNQRKIAFLFEIYQKVLIQHIDISLVLLSPSYIVHICNCTEYLDPECLRDQVQRHGSGFLLLWSSELKLDQKSFKRWGTGEEQVNEKQADVRLDFEINCICNITVSGH